jgi:hypothetical protein
MSDPSSGRYLTRQDLETVIRRAAELEVERGSAVPELSETDLLRIASEVGLSEESVRRALAEHRATAGGDTLLAEHGSVSRLCGPGLVTAIRTVSRPAEEVRRRLESHFAAGESLRLVRRTGSSSLWEPDRGVVASVMRGLDVLGRGYQLAKKARAVELRVVPITESSSRVVLTADLGGGRAEWFWGLGVAAGGAAVAAASVFIVGLPSAPDAAALGTPALLALTIFLARAGYRRALERMRLVLDGLLDRIEHDEALEPPRPSWRDLLR